MSKFALFTKATTPEPVPPQPPGPVDSTHVFVAYSLESDETSATTDTTWSGVYNSVSGTSVDNGTNGIGAGASYSSTGPTNSITRSHFEFDLSQVDSTGRELVSVILDVCGFGYDTADVIVQESTFIPSGSGATNNFSAFTGPLFIDNPVHWDDYVDPDPYPHRNLMPLNAAGIEYIRNNLGGTVKLCCREYDHDYLNVQPGDGESYRGGCYFREANNLGIPNRIETPRLILKYVKTESWTPYFDNTRWSNFGGSWDGTYWQSGASDIDLYPLGGWEAGYTPSKVRITFTGQDYLYMYIYNTEGSFGKEMTTTDLLINSGDEIIINGDANNHTGWNNLDIAELYLYSDVGSFTVTNIEFLDP